MNFLFFQSKILLLSSDCRRECKRSHVDTSLDTKTFLFNPVFIQPQCHITFVAIISTIFFFFLLLTL